MKYPLYINGEFVETKDKQKIINPSTGEVLTEVSLADEQITRQAIQAARNAFDHGPWKSFSLSQRKEIIQKISDGILEQAAELAELETLNTGKPIKEATFMDIPSSAETFHYFAHNLQQFLSNESKHVSNQITNCTANLVYEPHGACVLIVPWNYPLLIACWKLAQSLAAGNTVVLKPSSLTPLTVLELAKIIHKSGIPAGVVNIIVGKGDCVGKVLCESKDVDMISFTGSNEVGKKILEYSSTHVKKLSMELGGKSAGIVLEDADLEVAVNGSLCSIFLNQGQMCTAMSRLLVADKIFDQFVSEFVKKTKQIKVGPGIDFQSQMGPLISDTQRKRVADFVMNAQKEGAHIACGGAVIDRKELSGGFFFEPTVLINVRPSMSVWNSEVFGPVVCIARFHDENELVELANQSDFALASCIWAKDTKKAQKIAAILNAGTVWINTYGMFLNELPYGGFKQSGFGKELGREGFLEYCRLKNVVIDQSQDSKPLVNYWYGF